MSRHARAAREARVSQLATATRPDVIAAAAAAAKAMDAEVSVLIADGHQYTDEERWREVSASAVGAALNRLICPDCNSSNTGLGAPQDAEYPDEYDPATVYCARCGGGWVPDEALGEATR
jgi:hypothetical protein